MIPGSHAVHLDGQLPRSVRAAAHYEVGGRSLLVRRSSIRRGIFLTSKKPPFTRRRTRRPTHLSDVVSASLSASLSSRSCCFPSTSEAASQERIKHPFQSP
jgi:hypothetical protein